MPLVWRDSGSADRPFAGTGAKRSPSFHALGWFAGNISEAVEMEVGINKNHIVLQVTDNGLGLAHPKE